MTLIIPCHNEADRLDFEIFDNYKDVINFFFVDDGSDDNTSKLIAQKGYPLLCLTENIGKGPAIRRGLLQLIEDKAIKTKWVGYWDADLTIDLKTLEEMGISNLPDTYHTVWTSRYKSFLSITKSSLLRGILGLIFSRMVRSYMKIDLHDTQCGAKVFRTHYAEELFKQPFLSRWLFDIELYFRLPRDSIMEYPITSWQNQTGSKVSLLKDGLAAIMELREIKKKYQRVLK